MIKIHLIISVLCCLISKIQYYALKAEWGRKGYKYKKVKHSVSEFIIAYIYFLIPIVNIFMLLVFLFGSETMFNKLAEEGKLYKEESE